MKAHEARDLSDAVSPGAVDDAAQLNAALQVIRVWAELGRRYARVPHLSGRRNTGNLLIELRALGYIVGPVLTSQGTVLVTW